MTDQLTARRGKDAALVLDNEAFKLAMGSLKASVLEQLKACPIRDKEGALLLLQLAKLTDRFEAVLVGMVQNGKLAEHQIDLDALRDESRARRFMRKLG